MEKKVSMKIDLTQYCGTNHTRDTHLLALEIEKTYRENERVLLSLGTDGWDIVENGIEQVVKDIADKLNIPYSNITFESTDRLGKSETFVVNIIKTRLLPNNLKLPEFKNPDKNNFGLFIGRGTNERLYAFWKAKKMQNGIVTCHVNTNNVTEHKCDFAQFICEHNDKWQEIKLVLPCSDIIDNKFNHGAQDSWHIIYRFDLDHIWRETYNNIAIEIVCETNTSPGTFFITEKTFRPLYYGRLFLVIGSPQFEQNLKDLGFDIFDDILDKSYDNLESYMRVDAVFDSLQKYIDNPVDYNILKQRLINNQKLLVKVAHERLL